MCTNLINLLINGARLFFVCRAAHLHEKQKASAAMAPI